MKLLILLSLAVFARGSVVKELLEELVAESFRERLFEESELAAAGNQINVWKSQWPKNQQNEMLRKLADVLEKSGKHILDNCAELNLNVKSKSVPNHLRCLKCLGASWMTPYITLISTRGNKYHVSSCKCYCYSNDRCGGSDWCWLKGKEQASACPGAIASKNWFTSGWYWSKSYCDPHPVEILGNKLLAEEEDLSADDQGVLEETAEDFDFGDNKIAEFMIKNHMKDEKDED